MVIVSCTPEESNIPPLRDYTEQYAKDIAVIEEYLQTHYMEVINNPGATNDQSVTYTLIPAGGTQTSIWDQTQYPLQIRYVQQNDIVYKIYYLKLRQGSGTNSKSPCSVDQVLTSYRGEYIFTSTETINEEEVKTIKSKQFEESIDAQTYFNLTAVIRGWSEIFPLFKTGSYAGNPDGTLSYFDFGAGVMFTFTCTEKNCANQDIQYNVLGSSSLAECGGCKATLLGTNERPDPEIQARVFGAPENN